MKTIRVCLVVITIILCSAVAYFLVNKAQERRDAEVKEAQEQRDAEFSLVNRTAMTAYQIWIASAEQALSATFRPGQSKKEKAAAEDLYSKRRAAAMHAYSAVSHSGDLDALRAFTEHATSEYERIDAETKAAH